MSAVGEVRRQGAEGIGMEGFAADAEAHATEVPFGTLQVGRKLRIVIIEIGEPRLADAALVSGAGISLGGSASGAKSGEQDGEQDGDDGDSDSEFDEGKGAIRICESGILNAA